MLKTKHDVIDNIGILGISYIGLNPVAWIK
jgi:hypothetical protein